MFIVPWRDWPWWHIGPNRLVRRTERVLLYTAHVTKRRARTRSRDRWRSSGASGARLIGASVYSFKLLRPICLSGALFFLACRPGEHSFPDFPALEKEAPFSLVRTAALGDDLAPDSALFGAGILASIRDVSQVPSGDIFVLDSDFKKVAIFDASGSYKRLGPAGFGQGPGEFRLPIAMDITPAGGTYIYDFNNARLTRFGPDNEAEHAIHLPGLYKDFIIHRQQVFTTEILTTAFYLHAFNLDGKPIGTAIPLSEVDSVFAPEGSVGRFGRRLDGRPMLAIMRPGVWFELINGDEWIEYGLDILNGPSAIQFDDRLRNVAQVYGIAEVKDVGVLIAFGVFDFADDGQLSGYVAVFNDDEYLGVLPLPVGHAATFTSTADGQGVLLNERAPYPQIVRYDLRISVEASSAGPHPTTSLQGGADHERVP